MEGIGWMHMAEFELMRVVSEKWAKQIEARIDALEKQYKITTCVEYKNCATRTLIESLEKQLAERDARIAELEEIIEASARIARDDMMGAHRRRAAFFESELKKALEEIKKMKEVNTP